jgi:hypothetical protein
MIWVPVSLPRRVSPFRAIVSPYLASRFAFFQASNRTSTDYPDPF